MSLISIIGLPILLHGVCCRIAVADWPAVGRRLGGRLHRCGVGDKSHRHRCRQFNHHRSNAAAVNTADAAVAFEGWVGSTMSPLARVLS